MWGVESGASGRMKKRRKKRRRRRNGNGNDGILGRGVEVLEGDEGDEGESRREGPEKTYKVGAATWSNSFPSGRCGRLLSFLYL